MQAHQAWYDVLAWLLIGACAYSAFIFGRFSKAAFDRYPRGHVPTRTRVGVAVSIAGPLLCLVVGFGAAAVTGRWIQVAIGTLIAIIAIAGVGLFLAPR